MSLERTTIEHTTILYKNLPFSLLSKIKGKAIRTQREAEIALLSLSEKQRKRFLYDAGIPTETCFPLGLLSLKNSYNNLNKQYHLFLEDLESLLRIGMSAEDLSFISSLPKLRGSEIELKSETIFLLFKEEGTEIMFLLNEIKIGFTLRKQDALLKAIPYLYKAPTLLERGGVLELLN